MTETAAATAPTGATRTSKGTRYVVLTRMENGDWRFTKPGVATSAEAAIRAVAAELGAAEYIAVPARSWNPVKVTVEKTTVVKLG